jgi:RNA polymerase sigma-70 factor (ECF subfamily)
MLNFFNKKNKDRFEKEILIHLDSVFRLAFFHVRDYDEASDLTQETMLKAFRFFDSFREDTNGKAWLFKILHNTLINARKKTSREREFLQKSDNEINKSAGELSLFYKTPEAHAVSKVTKEQIYSSLNNIPQEYRAALIMCDAEGFSYREIAEILECPVGTVMSRIYRGRSLLKEKLLKKVGAEAIDDMMHEKEGKDPSGIVSFLDHVRNEHEV